MGSRRQFGSVVPNWPPPPPGTGRSRSLRRDTISGTARDLNRTQLRPRPASDGGSSRTHVSKQICLPPALIVMLQLRRTNSTTIATAGHSSIQPSFCCVAKITRPRTFPNLRQSVGPFTKERNLGAFKGKLPLAGNFEWRPRNGRKRVPGVFGTHGHTAESEFF